MPKSPIHIRQATAADHDAIWQIFHAVVAPGDTYALDPDISREEAFAYWLRADTHTYVAEADNEIVGTYTLRPNASGGGAHVSNASFMVAPSARGKGIGARWASIA